MIRRPAPTPKVRVGRRSVRVAIRAMREELVAAVDAAYVASERFVALGGDPQQVYRPYYRALAVRAALAAMEDFGLGE